MAGRKETALDLSKFVDKGIQVKLTGGRQVTGTLKGYDQLLNLVLDEAVESERGKNSDAVEVAGKDVLSTSSTVTIGLVSHKYGEKAVEATNEGLDAAGHAIGTTWAVFKIWQALNPKSVLKPMSLAKSSIKAGAAELRAKSSKSK